MHEEFFSDGNRQVNVFIVGIGTVGKKLLAQIEQQSEFLRGNLRLNARVVGLANSKKVLFDQEGLDLSDFAKRISEFGKEFSSPSAAISDLIIEQNLRNSVFVDITASAEVVENYPKLLQKRFR